MKRVCKYAWTIYFVIFTMLFLSCTNEKKSFVENDHGITISFPTDQMDYKLTLDVVDDDIIYVRAYKGDTKAFQPSLIAMDNMQNPE